MRLTAAQRRITRIIALAGLIVAAVLVLHLYPRSGADRIKHMIAWPGGCESVGITSISMFAAADQQVSIQCQMLGPSVVYARFSSVAQRDRQLRLTPPTARTLRADAAPGNAPDDQPSEHAPPHNDHPAHLHVIVTFCLAARWHVAGRAPANGPSTTTVIQPSAP